MKNARDYIVAGMLFAVLFGFAAFAASWMWKAEDRMRDYDNHKAEEELYKRVNVQREQIKDIQKWGKMMERRLDAIQDQQKTP